MVKSIETRADEYMEHHSSGNSYIDEKVRQAYAVGAREAVSDLREWMGGHLTPFYQRLVEQRVEKMMK